MCVPSRRVLLYIFYSGHPYIQHIHSPRSPAPSSPAIKAASEKLAALKVDDQKPESKSPLKIGATSSEAFPSASTDVLEAQRKRFEELKVGHY